MKHLNPIAQLLDWISGLITIAFLLGWAGAWVWLIWAGITLWIELFQGLSR